MFASVLLCFALFVGANFYPEANQAPLKTKELLSLLNVQPEVTKGYSRKLFPHWSDHDGCSTRESVLRRDSLVKFPARDSRDSCTVTTGPWLSVYDNKTLHKASDVDVDHVVALSEAWKSGASSWSPSMRKQFANDLSDPRTLRAVTDYVNMEKGDKDPSKWLPSHAGALCTYVSDWISIKLRWKLSVDKREYNTLKTLLHGSCANQTTLPWSAP